MQVVFDSHDPEAAWLRQNAVRRMLVAMRHVSWLVPRARVQLSRSGSTPDAPGKRCRVELQTLLTKPVAVTSIAKDWSVALESALARAVQTLRGNWHRHQARARYVGGMARRDASREALAHDATRNAWSQMGRRLVARSMR